MIFKPGSSKQSQEVPFQKKKKIKVDPIISLNNVQVERVSYQKHLGISYLMKNLISNNM